MELSKLHFHSIGRVSSVKERNSKEVMVMLTEWRFGTDEEIISLPTVDEISFATNEGEDNQRTVIDNSVPCIWLSLNSNRITAPDVRRDDRVLVWRLGDTERYFWTDFNDANVKRLETVIYAISADPKNGLKGDLSNAYFLAISSHDKHITLKTSQANGEPFGYTLQFNTGDGRVVLEDTDNNQFFLDSAETIIGMINAKKTSLLLDKKNIKGYAPDSMTFKAENTISFACTDFKIDASSSISENTKSYTINTDSYKLTCKTMNVTADSVMYACPNSIFSGVVKAASIVIGGGGAKSGGAAASVVGNMNVQGDMSISGKLTVGELAADKGHISQFSHGGGKCC